MRNQKSKPKPKINLFPHLLIAATLFSLSKPTRQKDTLQRQIDEYHTHLSKIHNIHVNPNTKEHKVTVDNIYNLLGKAPNGCTSTRSFSQNQNKQYLKAFAEGNCSPVILIPGIGATKLIAKINCKILQKKSPKIFKACGWESCNEHHRYKSLTPLPEYTIWVPGLDSPMSFIRPFFSSKLCFEGMMGFRIVQGKGKNKIKLESVEGVEVRVMGDTAGSDGFADSKCGLEAIEDLAPLSFQPKIARYYRMLATGLEASGYKLGLTMQALPFDWRRKVADDDSRLRLRKILKEMYEMTGKRVTVVSHSLGSYYALDLLWSMGQAEKDRMVARWIALAPPLVGALKSVQTLIGKIGNYSSICSYYFNKEKLRQLDCIFSLGFELKNNILIISNGFPYFFVFFSILMRIDDFTVDVGIFKFGITSTMLDKTLALYEGNDQLVVRRFYRLHQNEPWMEPLLTRISQEHLLDNRKSKKLKKEKRRIPPSTSLSYQGVMSIFPPSTKKCTPGFIDRNPACITGIKFMWDLGQVADKKMNPDTLNDILDLHSYFEESSEILEDAIDSRYDIMENPGVQVNIIYSAMIETTIRLFYKLDPRSWTTRGRFYPPDSMEKAMGDGTVLAASALGPGIKWADQFRRGAMGAKPVNLIELCSNYKRRSSIFDDMAVKRVTKNAYFGMDCGCRSIGSLYRTDGLGCNHANMMSDSKLLTFILNSLKTTEKGKVGQRFLDMSDFEMIKYVRNCELFNQK